MMFPFFAITWLLTITPIIWAKPVRHSLPCAIRSFQGVVSLSGVAISVLRADPVAENGTYGDATDLGFPQPIDRLPELCAVTVQITNTSDEPSKPISSYQLGMYLPTNYTGRFLAVGSASFAGGINWQGMSEGPHYGLATISTDNGHNSTEYDMSWANPQTLYDWGYRAMHGSVVVGKLLINHYYRQNIKYSYYAGCSTAGRQGLKEIQYDAHSFDGALIGAASWDIIHLMPWISKIAYEELKGNQLMQPQIDLIAAEVLNQCDSQDGYLDNIVSKPESCFFNISRIICSNSESKSCISTGQAQTALRIWSDYKINGKLVNHGFDYGSENQWSAYFPDSTKMQKFNFDFERYAIYNNSMWMWQNFSDQVVKDMEHINPGQATANHFDISTYRDRGGKILMYHGLADGLISSKTSMEYYSATIEAMETNLTSLRTWFRYFQVPGMQHCFFSNHNAPWHFGAWAQAAMLRLLTYFNSELVAYGEGWSVPKHMGDPEFDAYSALMAWVEENRTINHVIATAFNTDWSVNRTRPLCAYPERAVYIDGDINNAGSWRCR